jgi:hypothetical protein
MMPPSLATPESAEGQCRSEATDRPPALSEEDGDGLPPSGEGDGPKYDPKGAVGASGLPSASFRRFPLHAGMRPVSNVCYGESDEFPDHEVNVHLGYSGSGIGERSGVELPSGPTHSHPERETGSARSTPKGGY